MIADIRFQGMLEGARGLPKVNNAAIAELPVRVSTLASAHPEISVIDLNPVIPYGAAFAIGDARMILADGSGTE